MRSRLFRVSLLISCLVVFCFGALARPAIAFADAKEDFSAIFGDHAYYEDNTSCSSSGSSGSSSTASASGKVYMIGDSITEGTKTELDASLKKKGFTSVEINGKSSRSLSEGGDDLNGISVLDKDKNKFKDAGAVIIALGTNNGVTDGNIEKTIKIIKDNNSGAKIFWVNIGADNSKRTGDPIPMDQWNTTLQNNASKGYTIIDWASQVKAHGEYINSDPAAGLGVHPDGAGKQAFADTVAAGAAGGLTTGSTTSPNSSGICCSSGGNSATLTGDDNRAKIFNYLVGKGLTDFQAAGIVGNMSQESHFEPKIIEYGFPNGRGEISQAGQPSSLSDTVPPDANSLGQPGYGLIGFTARGYKDGLIKMSQDRGVIAGDLGLQLDFLWKAMTEGVPGTKDPGFADRYKQTKDVVEATTLFENDFEVHAGPPQPQRITAAQDVLSLAQSGGIASTTASASGSTQTASTKPVIVLDPGHSGTTTAHTDPATGLYDGDSHNVPENEGMFDVATRVKAKLEQDGYQVTMTKQAATDVVFLRDRANIANQANANLAVSMHTTGDKAFGTWQQIYTQKVGLYRGEGNGKQVFTDADLAAKSKQYAEIMKTARDATEATGGSTTDIVDNNFDGRAPIPPGNIPEVQLWSKVPWIYLEAGGGANNEGLNDSQKSIFANAIIAGIEKAVPVSAAAGSGCSSTTGTGMGSIVDTAIKFSWPYDGTAHGKTQADAKPEYSEAFQKFYLALGGGTNDYPYSDCGVFVGTVMRASGADPNYPLRLTSTQADYLKSHPDKYTIISEDMQDSSLPKPGDILVYNNGSQGHTAIYVGPQPGGAMLAEAAVGNHVPELAASLSWLMGMHPILARPK